MISLESPINIISLTKKDLKKAIRLVESVFKDEDESAKRELEASVYPRKFEKYVKKRERDIKTLEYFVAVNARGRLVGIIGAYTLGVDYADTLWIGWFCVHKKHRGEGIGRMLIEFIIEKARALGKSYVSLYTSTEKNEEKAQKLYDSYGFEIIHREEKKDYEIIYRKKTL